MEGLKLKRPVEKEQPEKERKRTKRPLISQTLAFSEEIAADLTGGSPGSWSFDSKVAARFDREAECHIPDYTTVIELSVKAAAEQVRDGRTKEQLQVIDVGVATGNTLKAFLDAGFHPTGLSGVDAAGAMLSLAKEKLPPGVQFFESQTYPLEAPAMDAIISNWTLHFITDLTAREQYIQDIFQGLAPGGVLILTEKTAQSDMVRGLYHDWKRSQGVSDEEVAAKAQKLQGVLVPCATSWYEDVLARSGFSPVQVVWARYGFVTWIARKPAATQSGTVNGTMNGTMNGVAAADTQGTVESSFRRWNVSSGEELSARHVQQLSGLSQGLDPSPFRATYWQDIFPYAVATFSASQPWEGSEGTAIKAAAGDESSPGFIFGFVTSGQPEQERGFSRARLRAPGGEVFELTPGMYFCVPATSYIQAIGDACGVIVAAPKYRGMLSVGGPIESKGRLAYIDGCSDTLLISPLMFGDPCFNHLHFPKGIKQTLHTHPSGRAGLIVRGRGWCLLPAASIPGAGDDLSVGDDAGAAIQRVPLEPGTAFVIPTVSLPSTLRPPHSIRRLRPSPDSIRAPGTHPCL